jgi:ABC-2 type transport system permease protein
MKKVMRLVSIQLWAVLSDMLSIGKTQKKRPKVLYAGVVLFTLLMSSVSFLYCFMIGSGLRMFNSIDILPALMMAITCVVIVLTTVFKVKGTIFGFRDYDLVMSLPISTGAIVACRLIILYALNFLFVFIMMVPMMIAYGILVSPEPMFYIISSVLIFFLPLVPIVVSSVLGTLIAYAASKFRRNNLLNIIFSLGLFMIFIGLSFTMEDDGQELVDMGKNLTNQVNSIYPLAKMYTNAVLNYDITAVLTFIGISLIAFVLYTVVVKKIFKRMNTLMMTGSYRVNFKMGELKTSSPFKALYWKELKRFFSSTLYVLNTGIGIVMLTVGAIAINFVDLGTILGSPQAAEVLAGNVPIYVAFCIIMTCTSMASISLEGKNLWIIKSMPVSPKTVYMSKIAVNLTILSPAVLDTILIGIALDMGLLLTLSMILVTIACSIFIAFYGLIINLLLPNFGWTSEVIVIKQSAACMITIFSGMGYVGILFLFIFLMPNLIMAYLSYFLLTVVLDIALFMILSTYGKSRYYSLS